MTITAQDFHFLNAAAIAAKPSRDPSTQTGAVLVSANGSIIGTGCNEHPLCVERHDLLHVRELKYKTIIHCEDWAVWNAVKAGHDTKGSTLYTHPFMSCAACSVKMVRAGVTRIVANESDNPRWQEEFALARSVFDAAGVKIDLVTKLQRLEFAANALLIDIKRRHPGEELRCPLLRNLDSALI